MTARHVSAAGYVVISRADLAVAFISPTECHVRLQVTIDGDRTRPLEHRLVVFDGTRVSTPRVSGATTTEPPVPVGRTLALMLARQDAVYAIEYNVTQPQQGRFRCPVWLPTVPTAAGPGRVHLSITLPPGSAPAGSRFPLLSWTDGRGEAILGDLPSTVRTTFAGEGTTLPWTERMDPARTTDVVAVAILITATTAWGVVNRRRRS